MKYLFFLIIFFPYIAQANISLVGKGHIAHVPIEMHLEVNNAGETTGSYFYTKTKNPIKLKGSLVEHEITLKTVGDPKIKEAFKGTVIIFDGEISRITGKWVGIHGGYGKNSDGYDFKVEGRTNPLLDRNLTCEEMEEAPELAFELGDLGSGHGSPNSVDYRCPKSLSQLDFLQQIIINATEIRGHNGNLPNHCTGSIVHAQWRYFHFSLARLGYYPESYSSHRSKNKGMDYFKEWSYRSLYNREIYENYMRELERVETLLATWYVKNHKLDTTTADTFSKAALMRISNWGFGSYYYYWKPEELVPYTEEAAGGHYSNFLVSLSNSSKKQKLNSLNRILPHNPDTKFVKSILNLIKTTDIEKRSETPLSNALNSPNLVELLLENGFDPNHQNNFGKTALYYAVQLNSHDSVKVLLENGADINHKYQLEKDKKWNCSGIKQWGRTPLMHAAQHADLKMLKLLIQNGADFSFIDIKGSTAYDYAVKEGNKENYNYLASLSVEKPFNKSLQRNANASVE